MGLVRRAILAVVIGGLAACGGGGTSGATVDNVTGHYEGTNTVVRTGATVNVSCDLVQTGNAVTGTCDASSPLIADSVLNGTCCDNHQFTGTARPQRGGGPVCTFVLSVIRGGDELAGTETCGGQVVVTGRVFRT
jgi:hypothetical protein